MSTFLQSLLETLVYNIFWIAYPASLYFLYDYEQMTSFYLTSAIIILSIIYFILYCIIKSKENGGKEISEKNFITKQVLYCLIGYIVQINFIFMDTYEKVDGNLYINYTLSVLKILMIIETLKRIFFYVFWIILLFIIEHGERNGKIHRFYYIRYFKIAYFYLWDNFYTNVKNVGFELKKGFLFIGIIFCFIHGILALMCYFLAVKICFGFLLIGQLSAHIYTFYARHSVFFLIN